FESEELAKDNLDQRDRRAGGIIEGDPLNLLQVVAPGREHHASHRGSRADANVRNDLDVRNTLIFDDWNQSRVDFTTRKHVRATRGRRVSEEFDRIALRTAYKTPDQRRRVEIA